MNSHRNRRDALFSMRRAEQRSAQAEAIRQLAEAPGPSADLALMNLLQARDAFSREDALRALAARSETLGRVAAKAALTDTNILVRNAAANVLGEIGNSQDIRALAAALRDNHWVVRATVAGSIGRIGGKSAWPLIKAAAFHDRHPVVRRDAALALGKSNLSEFVPDLEQALAVEQDDQARIGLLAALYVYGQQERLCDLLRLLRSGDANVRHATVSFLPELVRDDDTNVAIGAIQEMLSHEINPGVRGDAQEALEEIMPNSLAAGEDNTCA